MTQEMELDIKLIRKRIEELGITYAEAAKRADMSKQRLANVLNNKNLKNVTLDTVERVAKALKMDPRELLKD